MENKTKELDYRTINLLITAIFLFVMFNLALNLLEASISVGIDIFSELLFHGRIDIYDWLSTFLKIGIWLVTIYVIYYFSKEMLFLLKYNRNIMERRIK